MTKDEAKELLEKHSRILSEHFDSVRIFATKGTEDGEPNTMALDTGNGNFYAQLGQIEEWLTIQRQYQKNWAIRKDDEDHGS